MAATYPILSLLLIFALSLLVIRVGSIALRMTGLTPEVASFQAASAFSGAGFTTQEAEHVVSTPERRAIVKMLIRLGSVGLVSVIASLVLSFTENGGENALNLAFIVGGATIIVVIARSQLLNRALTPVIERALGRVTDLTVKDYLHLLGLESEYSVAEVDVPQAKWLANTTPAELNLASEGVLLLGIRRGDTYVGAPAGDTEIKPGDTLVLYGKTHRLQELSGRGEDDRQAHDDAVEEHERVLDVEAERLRA